MITSRDFPALSDDLQDIFNEVARDSIANLTGYKVFKVSDTDRLTYDHLILHGLGGVKKVSEGQDLPNDVLVEGRIEYFFQNILNLKECCLL